VQQAHLREEVQIMSEVLEKSYEQEVFERALAQGLAKGKAEGEAEALRGVLQKLLRRHFPELPEAVRQRIAAADASELEAAIDRLLLWEKPATPEDVFR
jgi:hypothetical protein